MRVKYLLFAALSFVAFVGVYLLSSNLSIFQWFEQQVLNESEFNTSPSFPLSLVSPMIIVFVMVAVSIWSFWFFGIGRTIFFWFTTGIALFLNQLLKYSLPRVNLLVDDGALVENTMPSGHMSVFAALFMFILLGVAYEYRSAFLWLANTFTLVAAWQILQYGWHRPSDEIAAILVCLGVFLAAVAFLPSSFQTGSKNNLNKPQKDFTRLVNVFEIFFKITFAAAFIFLLARTLVEREYFQAISFVLVVALITSAFKAVAKLRV